MIKFDKNIILLSESDIHLSQKNMGYHNDYAEESLFEFKRTNERAKELKKKYPDKQIVIVQGGDFVNGRLVDKDYELKVLDLLDERMEITNGYSIILEGNHDQISYGMSERTFVIKRKLALDTDNIETPNVNFYLVDYGADYGKIIKPVKGKKNILLIHNQVQWADSPIKYYGDEWIDLSKKEFAGLDNIIAYHIHSPYRFKGKLSDNKECEVIYQGCSSRCKIDDTYSQGSHVIIDTETMKVEQEFYDLPKLNEIFDYIQHNIDNTRKKTQIKDILSKLEKFDTGGKDIKTIINEIDTDKEYKEKAIEYFEKGQGV